MDVVELSPLKPEDVDEELLVLATGSAIKMGRFKLDSFETPPSAEELVREYIDQIFVPLRKFLKVRWMNPVRVTPAELDADGNVIKKALCEDLDENFNWVNPDIVPAPWEKKD